MCFFPPRSFLHQRLRQSSLIFKPPPSFVLHHCSLYLSSSPGYFSLPSVLPFLSLMGSPVNMPAYLCSLRQPTYRQEVNETENTNDPVLFLLFYFQCLSSLLHRTPFLNIFSLVSPMIPFPDWIIILAWLSSAALHLGINLLLFIF